MTLDQEIEQKIEQLAKETAKKIAHESPPTPFRTQEQTQTLIKLEISDLYKRFFTKLQSGIRELSDLMQLPFQIDQLWQVFENIAEYEIQGKTPKDVCGLTDNQMEAFNSAATSLYEEQHYDKSASVYLLLSFLDGCQPAFWLGFGNSEYYNKNYETALRAYEMAALVNPSDFQCHLYASHCHHKLDQLDEALKSVDKALTIIVHQPAYKQWQKQAEGLKVFLKQVSRKEKLWI